ncbi:hypothetical protein TNCV_733311 [Trichonephila clavipes]|nr:hypothetical protein TNCV_733311 [Trichonephila clavipes]
MEARFASHMPSDRQRQSVQALAASPPTNKSILTDDGDDNVVISLAKRSKFYNPPAIHVMSFILAFPG